LTAAQITRIPNVQPETTARWIYETAEKAAGEPEIIHLARSIVREIEEQDPLSEALAVYDFLRSKIRYTPDPERFEVVFGPWRLAQLWQRFGRWSEDCDTISASAYALLRSIGHTCRIRVVSFQLQPWPEHVFCEALVHGVWLAVDASLPEKDVRAMLADIKHSWFFGPPQP
jgi:transglutaminase-like putative cysteine protease